MASSKPPPAFPPLLSDAEIEARRTPAPDSGPPVYDPWPPLEAGFPRIAKTIRDLWGSAELDRYLDRLLIDERGTRQGFPADVVEALLALSHRHSDRFHFRSPAEQDWIDVPLARRR